MEEMKQDRIEIKRDRIGPSAKATFGEIYVNGIKMGVTLELPKGRCISPGTYNAETYQSPKYERTVIMLKMCQVALTLKYIMEIMLVTQLDVY